MSPTVLYAQNVKYNSAEAALFLWQGILKWRKNEWSL